jgi:GTP cyclohydrolase II
MTKRKLFFGANIISAAISDTGSKGGDAGHGCHVQLTFNDISGTDWEVRLWHDKGHLECVTLDFYGDSERKTFIEALEFFLTELKSKP